VNILSSVRPLRDCAETRKRTLAANRSWRGLFDRIIYFGSPSPELGSPPEVEFMVSEQFPRIVDMVHVAAQLPGWTAIVNGDIIIGRRIKEAEAALVRRKASCAISKRYEFQNGDTRNGRVVDLGLDFFTARQEVWAAIAEEYPDRYRFGHSSWDALMLGAFNYHDRIHLFDLTGWRIVFHPKHGERRQIYFIDDTVRTPYRDYVSWPTQKL
jgi:hypothetical protein